MRFAIEFSADAECDFDLIFDHLFKSYVAFGEGTEEALEHAARRVMAIRKAADRRASFPLRGTTRDDTLPGIRFMAIARDLPVRRRSGSAQDPHSCCVIRRAGSHQAYAGAPARQNRARATLTPPSVIAGMAPMSCGREEHARFRIMGLL